MITKASKINKLHNLNASISLVQNDMLELNDMLGEMFGKNDNPLIQKAAFTITDANSKKIRPLIFFTLLKALSYNKDDRTYIKIAAVIEAIHNASLFHDDVIDDNDVRRGKQTLNKIYGEKPAVVIGDYLIAKCFFEITKLNTPSLIPGILAEAAMGMAKGAILETQMQAVDGVKIEHSLEIIALKTAVLFKSLALIAEELVGVHFSELANYAENIGMAFQVIDDILDYQPAVETGKKKGQDFFEQKPTLPLILAIKKASNKERGILMGGKDFDTAIEIMDKYQIFKDTQKYALDFAGKAKKSLVCLKPSPYLDSLIEIADFCAMP